MANEFDGLLKVIGDGSIITASRKDLERYAVLVCRGDAHHYFAGHQWIEVAEMVRLMLLVRISEEMQTKAFTISIVALVISCVALVAALVDAAASVYPLLK